MQVLAGAGGSHSQHARVCHDLSPPSAYSYRSTEETSDEWTDTEMLPFFIVSFQNCREGRSTQKAKLRVVTFLCLLCKGREGGRPGDNGFMPMGFVCFRMCPFTGAAVRIGWCSGWLKNRSSSQQANTS